MNNSKKELFEKITFNLMQPNEFRLINQWCIDEGWNVGIHDSELYYKIDSTGHYIAKTKEAVASLSLMKHSPTFFTLGPFIVHKLYRGQGIGEALWNAAFARMPQEHSDASITLFAVAEQVARYKKAGFKPVLDILRWHIPANSLITSFFGQKCTPITPEHFPFIHQYGQNHHGINQELLLQHLILQPKTYGLAFMDDNLIKGFGFIRPCVRGYRIGSLIADTSAIAQSLITELLVSAQNMPVIIDMPCSNSYGMDCMNAFHAVRAPHEDTIMMVKGRIHRENLSQLQQQYGLFSLEIG